MVSTNEHKNLRASSLSEAELEEKVRLAYLQTLMQSFLVGDLLKTGYFILISPIFHAHVRKRYASPSMARPDGSLRELHLSNPLEVSQL